MTRSPSMVFAVLAGVFAAACSPSGSREDANSAPMQGAAEPTADAPAAYRPAPAQRDAILATVQSLFDALETGDEALLRAIMDPSVVMHSSDTRDGRTTFSSSTVDGLAQRITAGGAPLIERMWDPMVLVNGPLATVWTPYDFYAGDDFSHCGVDAVTLQNAEGRWRIVGLSWTRLQPPACDLHPEGPPGG